MLGVNSAEFCNVKAVLATTAKLYSLEDEGSGRVASQTAISISKVITPQRVQPGPSDQAVISALNAIMLTAANLARRGMARSCSQVTSSGPT